MINVFMDDYRACPKGFVLARNAEECKLLLEYEEIGILSLDYDLGWAMPTGFEIVLHLVKLGRYPQEIYLHTSSESGKLQMYHMLMKNIPASTKLNNGPMPQAVLDRIEYEHIEEQAK